MLTRNVRVVKTNADGGTRSNHTIQAKFSVCVVLAAMFEPNVHETVYCFDNDSDELICTMTKNSDKHTRIDINRDYV